MLEERKGRRNNTKMYSLHFLYVLLKTYHILDTVLYHTSLCFISYVVSKASQASTVPRQAKEKLQSKSNYSALLLSQSTLVITYTLNLKKTNPYLPCSEDVLPSIVGCTERNSNSRSCRGFSRSPPLALPSSPGLSITVDLHVGHVAFTMSHSSMHVLWNRCLHLSILALSPIASSLRHMGQEFSPSCVKCSRDIVISGRDIISCSVAPCGCWKRPPCILAMILMRQGIQKQKTGIIANAIMHGKQI